MSPNVTSMIIIFQRHFYIGKFLFIHVWFLHFIIEFVCLNKNLHSLTFKHFFNFNLPLIHFWVTWVTQVTYSNGPCPSSSVNDFTFLTIPFLSEASVGYTTHRASLAGAKKVKRAKVWKKKFSTPTHMGKNSMHGDNVHGALYQNCKLFGP